VCVVQHCIALLSQAFALALYLVASQTSLLVIQRRLLEGYRFVVLCRYTGCPRQTVTDTQHVTIVSLHQVLSVAGAHYSPGGALLFVASILVSKAYITIAIRLRYDYDKTTTKN